MTESSSSSASSTTSSSTSTTTTTAKEQLEDADGEELTAMISGLIHELNKRPDLNPAETGEIVHRLLKSARDIQGEKDGFITKAESLRLAIDRHNEAAIAEAAAADNSSNIQQQ